MEYGAKLEPRTTVNPYYSLAISIWKMCKLCILWETQGMQEQISTLFQSDWENIEREEKGGGGARRRIKNWRISSFIFLGQKCST